MIEGSNDTEDTGKSTTLVYNRVRRSCSELKQDNMRICVNSWLIYILADLLSYMKTVGLDNFTMPCERAGSLALAPNRQQQPHTGVTYPTVTLRNCGLGLLQR